MGQFVPNYPIAWLGGNFGALSRNLNTLIFRANRSKKDQAIAFGITIALLCLSIGHCVLTGGIDGQYSTGGLRSKTS